MSKILLIDDSSEYRALLIRYINKIRDDIQVVEYDPETEKLPGQHFPWENYGLVILDYDLGNNHENGLGWLIHFQTIENMPPVVMLTGEGNADLAVKVLEAGAMDFIDKEDICDEVLATTLNHFFNDTDDDSSADQQQLPELLFNEERAAPQGSSTGKTIKSGFAFDQEEVMVKIPGYEIIQEIGRGGMSVVLLAKAEDSEIPIVLKVMFTGVQNDETSLKRFLQEYNLISSLKHPNVVCIYERAFAADFAYIAMEYFPGGDLTQKLKTRLPLELASSYIRQMCAGLVAIHDINIVHRDIKPGNILFREDGTLTITDFGAAKNKKSDAEDITINHAIVGTPYFMSPEQATGMPVDHRSDLYSLGILIYQMLTNEKPFVAKSIPQLISMHVNAPIPSLPSDLAQFQPLIDGLLAKDPDDRFQSANDVIMGMDWIGA